MCGHQSMRNEEAGTSSQKKAGPARVSELGLSALERLRPRKGRAATVVRFGSLRATPCGARARLRAIKEGAALVPCRPGPGQREIQWVASGISLTGRRS